MSLDKIGVVGLGLMGLPMAANLIKAGYQVSGYDIDSGRMQALELADRAGLERGNPLEVLRNSAAYSSAMDQNGGHMIRREYEPPLGKLAFHLKDVRLIQDLAARLEFPLVLSGLYAQALASQVAKGRGEWDNAAIMDFYRDLL